MTEQDERQLWLEIVNIFESGASELRVFNMVKSFIEEHEVKYNQSPYVSEQLCGSFVPISDISSATKCRCGWFITNSNSEIFIYKGKTNGIEKIYSNYYT